MITDLGTVEHFEQLKTEVLSLVEKHEGFNQIILQSKTPDIEDWRTGTGSITEADSVYCHLNKSLAGTTLGNIIEKQGTVRARIMVMPSRQCYSVHQDKSKRIHIPIVTSSQAWMIWPYKQVCARLIAGRMYLTDTREHHTFINGDLENRIHLVLCLK